MPLRATDAKKLIRRLLDGGVFVVPTHARERMDEHNLTNVDATNVLRGGVVGEAEYENGAWRYQVRTQRMVFVVEFDPEPEAMPSDAADLSSDELVVVTAWRIKR